LKTLIHVCCAPCLIGPLEALRSEGMEPAGFFYNPNIHPFLEFRKRVKALRVFLEKETVPMEIIEEYGLDLFMREVYNPDRRTRCGRCHFLRLHRTALRARERGLDAFTTTLLGSPHQDHDLLKTTGERVTQMTGMPFLYRDFRPLHERSHEIARKRQLYRQPYCGCCFSEYERFRDTPHELYRGGSPTHEREKT
jgi:predicted adenine nucleotide alpha hydrolase (AANH) superfamily ATPase